MKKILQLSTVHKSNDIRVYEKMSRSLLETNNIIYFIAIDSGVKLDDRVNFYPLYNKFKSDILNRFFNNLKTIFLIIKIKPNIIHFHDPELLIIGLFLQLFNKTVIYDVHEDVAKDIMHKKINNSIKKLIIYFFKPFEMFVASKIHNVIVVTPSIYNRFEGKVSNLKLIRNFPNNTITNNQLYFNEKISYVIYSGTISLNRGIVEIIEAISMFKGKIRLRLVGEFQNEALMCEIMNLEGWKYVDFMGFVSQEKLYEYYSTSLIGLVTLHNIDTYSEAFPVKLFEYVNSGLPVVMSDFNLWKSFFNEKVVGVYVEPSDPYQIYKGINMILENYEKYKSNVATYHGIYVWENEKKSLFEYYKNL
jgi:glycosyltransferase involved in cell wall biosynthesis